jgi:hypothetical protein
LPSMPLATGKLGFTDAAVLGQDVHVYLEPQELPTGATCTHTASVTLVHVWTVMDPLPHVVQGRQRVSELLVHAADW